MNAIKHIAFLANDNKNSDLIEWSYFNKHLLIPHEVIATGAAGKILEGTLNKAVCKLLSGSLGGYQQLSKIIIQGKVDAVIFFGGWPEPHPYNNDLEILLRTAYENNIIVATNRTTVDFVLTSILMDKDYSIAVKDSPFNSKENSTECKKGKSLISID